MPLKTLLLSSKEKNTDETGLVTQLFENGLEVFHLRKAGMSRNKMEEYIESIPPKYWGQIVIHSHYALAFKYNLMGIHIGKTQRSSKIFKHLTLRYYRLRRPEMTVSTSFHHLASLFEENYPYNYVMLSPVFDSISKSGYQSGFSHHNLSVAINRSRYKIMALGGVDIDKLEKIQAMHFDGIVLSGAIWQSENPLQDFIEIRKKVSELNLAHLGIK